MGLYGDNYGKENGNYRDYRGCIGVILYSVSLSVFGSQWRQLIH